MSTLDPQYNKRLAALLRRPEMATRDALKEILTSIRVEHAALTRAQEAHQREMAASMQALDRRMAEHEAAIEKMMNVDPNTLSRAQITRLARKLNL